MEWTKRFRKALTFSYDDGSEQDIRLAALLNRCGMKCTFNLNSGLGSGNVWEYKGCPVRRLDLPACREVYAGHEIAVHGARHLALSSLDPEALHQELAGDKARLTEIFGTAPVGMAYAYGDCNAAVTEKARSLGLRYGRGVWEKLKRSREKLRGDLQGNQNSIGDHTQQITEAQAKTAAFPGTAGKPSRG